MDTRYLIKIDKLCSQNEYSDTKEQTMQSLKNYFDGQNCITRRGGFKIICFDGIVLIDLCLFTIILEMLYIYLTPLSTTPWHCLKEHLAVEYIVTPLTRSVSSSP